jgi:nucleotide-binding universal stress UspA family protein
MIEYRTLLVPYDFSVQSEEALRRALDLQVRFDADLHLVHVLMTPLYTALGHENAPFPRSADEEDDLRRALRQVAMAASLRATRPIESRVVEGCDVAETLRAVAVEIDADLIVIGTHARSGIVHLLLGSVTVRTLRRVPCPVLAVRANEEDEFHPVWADPKGRLSSPGPRLETPTAAIERLARAGFKESFRACGGKLVSLEGQRVFEPEDLVVREIVRFEGESDPGDLTVLFALRTRDDTVAGTLFAGYGTNVDAETAAVVEKLEAGHAGETRGREHLRCGVAPMLECDEA